MTDLTDFETMDTWTYAQIRDEVKQAIAEASRYNTARFDHLLTYERLRRPGGVTWNQLETRLALTEAQERRWR